MRIREELELLDEGQLLQYIQVHETHDDYRDMFEQIHNWGYHSDFTYNNVTDPEKTTIKEYLIEYIMSSEDDE